VAIRFSEFKSHKRLPSVLDQLKCSECIERELQDQRNCGGYGNEKYTQYIGSMQFFQCPLSIPRSETYDIIELILTSEEIGIPVVGSCLLDQTRAYFEYRRVIKSEQVDCFKEIEELRKQDDKKRRNQGDAENQIQRRPPRLSREGMPSAPVINRPKTKR
jgi:hypothetical protein